jgi:Tol biopolymer transport system component
VAFSSAAPDLVASDNNATTDVFVHDRQTGGTTRVSVSSAATEGNGRSSLYRSSISDDGRYVAFRSDATDLVDSDTNATTDVFVHDRQTGQTTRVSVSSDGAEATGGSFSPSISDNGRFVVFLSAATDLVASDTNDKVDVFVHDRQTGQTTRVSVSSNGAEANDTNDEPFISAGGRYVGFRSSATNLVAGDTNDKVDVFVHDRQTDQTTRVSMALDGAEANGNSDVPSISADGRYVVFESRATNLVADDTNNQYEIFVHDRDE